LLVSLSNVIWRRPSARQKRAPRREKSPTFGHQIPLLLIGGHNVPVFPLFSARHKLPVPPRTVHPHPCRPRPSSLRESRLTRRAMFVEDMLILASASPRRHELLLAAGLPHIVRPSSIPELPMPSESPSVFVQRIAQEKALAVPHDPADIVLAADTVVCLGSGPDQEIFGKPRDDEDARRILRLLSGRDHLVYTGICLLTRRRVINDLAATTVSFGPLTEHEIEEYTRSGETRDKAGAYAIQGWASRFVTKIQGCYHNVVGLPVSLVYSHLKSL
jgi:septum formation protein